MSAKHPAWTRTRVGRNRVHWVAYDDRDASEGRRIVDQGYAVSLPEADAAARAALAAAGMYQARRLPSGFASSPKRAKPDEDRGTIRPAPSARPREYLYALHPVDESAGPLIAAHLVTRKTARRIYVTRRSCGPDQIGTDDECWGPDEPTIALDRVKLERDGSVYSVSHRHSDFFATRDSAMGDLPGGGPSAFAELKLRAPCTVDDIKSAYRRRALEVHPDRGGTPTDFQAVEAAYRRLLREAQAPNV